MILIFFIHHVFGFIPCSERVYENIFLEPMNPFYKEQFQINQNNYKSLDDAFGFGFWTQFRPYQDVLTTPQFDQEFQPAEHIDGQLLFAIRNIDTNQFETVYYVQYPLLNDKIFQMLLQQNLNFRSDHQFGTFTNWFEGQWVYTHLQFVPLRSELRVNFLNQASLEYYTLEFNTDRYGNKEIIIGGKGKIFDYYNLEEFHGRMSRPIQFEQQQLFLDNQGFLDHFGQLQEPSQCSQPIKIDIIKDLVYMDSEMQFSKRVQLYNNAYGFGGWAKVDFSNSNIRQIMPLIRGTINKIYENDIMLGDRSFSFEYQVDLFKNISSILVKSYSFDLPIKGKIQNYGKTDLINIDLKISNEIQQWHFLKYTYGNIIKQQRIELVEVYFPNTKYKFEQYNLNGINSNQFTADLMYLYIGVDNYQIQSQFKGWIQDLQIWTCLDTYPPYSDTTCHYTCQPTVWCQPAKCESCPPNSFRKFLTTTKQCQCDVGYYSIENQTICQNLQENFKYLQFAQLSIKETVQCQFGYYQYNKNCFQCPLNIRNKQQVQCLECINNKLSWYLIPICLNDYIKLIGNQFEPFYSNSRKINDIELYKIDLQQYLHICLGCYSYCDSLIPGCYLSNNYHLGEQMIVMCKQNYFFDQNTKLCTQCSQNCELCDFQGQCLRCETQHYFDPIYQECLQCDIRCLECQFDLTITQQVCINCPEYFTLSNGKCLKCGIYCKFCKPATNANTGQIYARCLQCIDNRKYFISFDAQNCQINIIQNCLYVFQYLKNDRHITTIDMLFEPTILDSTVITACAKCNTAYVYINSESVCEDMSNNYAEYSIQETRADQIVCLSAKFDEALDLQKIQTTGGCDKIYNCDSCLYSKTDGINKCSQCNTGYYLSMLRGNCIECPAELNSLVCKQQQKINKDYFKQEYLAFYEYFVNFDGTHDFQRNAQSLNKEDYEIVSNICHAGYQQIEGQCIKDCAEHCAECIYINGIFQCLQCFETIQGIMLTLVNNECIQCPFNCAVCFPQDPMQIFQYNPYFNNNKFQYFTHVCLQIMEELQPDDYYQDTETGHYVECLESKSCEQEAKFEMTVHCDDFNFDLQLSQSFNPIEFKQQNIKLSQLFSGSNEPHIPEYQNDVVYKRLNEKSIKIMNQTFIFTNISECVISEISILKNSFSENVYSIKWVHINLIALDDNVKVFFSNSLQFQGFSNVNLYNMELISLANNQVIIITFSSLINTNILMNKIKLTTISERSAFSFSAFNSSELLLQDFKLQNFHYESTNFFNIQYPLWNFKGIKKYISYFPSLNLNLSRTDSSIILLIKDFSILNCTFNNSNIIQNLRDNQYYYFFRSIVVYAEFFNSLFISDTQPSSFPNKTVHFENIYIQAKIIHIDGFFNFQNISNLTIDNLTYQQSLLNNSTFIKSNSAFSFNFLTFINLQMTGKSTLLKYVISDTENRYDVEIFSLIIKSVSYEQIYSFLYMINPGVNNQVKISKVSLVGNYLASELQKTQMRLYYYSALIYIEMANIHIIDTNILRLSGYYEFALVNTQIINVKNFTIQQMEQIKGLHQYLHCLNNQGLGNQLYSVISIYKAMQTSLSEIYAYNLTLYNYPLIQYQSTDLSENSGLELFNLTNSVFISIMIIITEDIKSASIILIESKQTMLINMENLQFTQNHLNTYINGIYIHTCLINLQCFNGTVVFDQLKALDNLVSNSTFVLFYLDVKTFLLQNSIFKRSNIFDYQKIKSNIMPSFPQDISGITIESLQEAFPIISSGVFQIIFNILNIDGILIESACGCKGGGFQLLSKKRGIANIKNSNFTNIRPSLNCNQSFGGVFYLDSTLSQNFQISLTKIYVTNVISLNQGGFIYLLSDLNEVSLTINQVEASNYQSLQGSFLYASLSQSLETIQKITIFNCSLRNEITDYIEYLGYLSTLEIDQTNILMERAQFYINNYEFSIKYIMILVLNFESFVKASGCKQVELAHMNFGNGNYSRNPLFTIELQTERPSQLFIDNIYIQNFQFIEGTLCQYQLLYNIIPLSFLCEYNETTVLPSQLEQIITTDFLINQGECYLYKALNKMNYQSFSIFKIVNISSYHQIRINDVDFMNIKCKECHIGLLNLNFEQGINNFIQIQNLRIFNSSCGTSGCVLLSSGVQVQINIVSFNRFLNTLERDYVEMNFAFKIYRFTCLNNIAALGVCLYIDSVELQVIDSYFSNNIATSQGGAIYSTNAQEKLSLIRTVFQNNSAQLGSNIIYLNSAVPNITMTESISTFNYSSPQTSYLIDIPQTLKVTKSSHSYLWKNKVQLQTSTLKIDLSVLEDPFYLPNGQALSTYQYYDLKIDQYVPLNQSFRLIALNIFDQEQINIQGSICEIYSRIVQSIEDETEFSQDYTNPTLIQFNNTSKDYNLDNVIFYFPFTYDELDPMYLQLQFKCDSIKVPIFSKSDKYNIQNWHYSYYLRTSLIKPISCQIGEIRDQDTQICHLCDSSSGFYSVKFNSSQCESMNELTMISVTSVQINLKDFYWRPYVTSNLIENCFNFQQNCIGSWQYGDKSCFMGHIGALCEQCDLYNTRGDGQFSISNAYTCGSCQSISQNILIISLASIFTLFSIIISVKSTDEMVIDLCKWTKYMSTGVLVANQKAMAGILIKILTNYLQIVGSLSTFKLQMPNWINQVIVTSSDPISQMTYSLDCFLIEMFTFPILYGRILWHIIMAFIYTFAAIIIFYFLKRKANQSFSSGILSTILIYTFVFLQPNIIKSLISSISYRNISGYKWVQGHVAYRYDSDSHQIWLIYLICILIFIGILIPLYFYYKLFQIKNTLNDLNNRTTWGYLYNEYSKWAYYWEIVKILLKEIIIIILTFYEDQIFLKAVLISLGLMLFQHYLVEWKPYNLSFLNRLDVLSTNTCSVSMIIGFTLYMSQQQNIFEVQYPFFFVLFIFNVNFLCKNLYQILIAYSEKFQFQIDELKSIIRQKCPKLIQLIPSCAQYLESKTVKRNQVKLTFKNIVRSIILQQKSSRGKHQLYSERQ